MVRVDGQPLPLRLDLRNHSPTGFEWGYEGSGPAQLALAILSREIGDSAATEGGLYQEFKRQVISRLTGNAWTLASDEVVAWKERHRARSVNGDEAIRPAAMWPAGEGGPGSWIREGIPHWDEYAQAQGFELAPNGDKCQLLVEGTDVFGTPRDWEIMFVWLWGQWAARRLDASRLDG